MPQLQLLMEILNLESCDFIQYKPEALTWPGPVEFQVTHVTRDREWFAEKLPIMEAFWNRVLWHREHGVDDLLPPPKKTRAKKILPPPRCCIIDCDEDFVEDEEAPSSPPQAPSSPPQAPSTPDQEPWDYSYL